MNKLIETAVVRDSTLWAINRLATNVEYGLDLDVAEILNSMYDNLREKIDINTLTKEDAIELGMRKWDADLWLFPLWMTNLIPEGFKVIDIFGGEVEYHKGKIDNDTRFGLVSYGIIIKEGSDTSDQTT